MAEKTGLDVSLFTLGAPGSEGSLLANVKALAIRAENQLVDARGIADAFELNQVVKQAQALDFTVFLDRGDGLDPSRKMTSLDATVWSFDGTDYAGQLRSGDIAISVPVKDRSALKNLERYPTPVGGIQVELRSELLVVDSASFANRLLTSPISGFHVTVAVTYGGSSASLPMMFRSAAHRVDRGELQLEEVVLHSRGTPTASGTATLLEFGAGWNGEVRVRTQHRRGPLRNLRSERRYPRSVRCSDVAERKIQSGRPDRDDGHARSSKPNAGRIGGGKWRRGRDRRG